MGVNPRKRCNPRRKPGTGDTKIGICHAFGVFGVKNNCLKDNIFITVDKRSAIRGIDTLKNTVWKTALCKVRSSRALLYVVCGPAAALRLRPVMRIKSFGLFGDLAGGKMRAESPNHL